MAMKTLKDQSGMTLLEVMVAVALMVIVSAISYTSLNGLIDGKQHTDKTASELQREIITKRQLNSDFESIINRDIKSHRGQKIPAVSGQLRNFSLVRNGYSNPLNQLRSDLQRVQWFYRNGELIRRQTQQLETQQAPQWQERVFLENVKDLRVEYINRQGVRSSTWPLSEHEKTPRQVELKIELKDDREILMYLIPNVGWL
jgi:general secretion pathway protein J